MNKYSYIFSLILLMLVSCDSFLDTENYVQKNTSNFPKSPSDIDMMLTGVYSSFNHMVGGKGQSHPQYSYFYIAEIASDERFGGGQFKDKSFQTIDKLMNYTYDMMEPFWKACYEGIYRANMIIENIDNIENWETENEFKQKKGEAYFLRSLLYQYLIQIFGEVPLTLSSTPENLPKSPAKDVYASIASDLKFAIETMPDRKYDPEFSGHATKYIAEAFMARIYLFYTGYYKQDSLPLPDGSKITKEDVIKWLEDCIENSGYGLVDDFRTLWPYTNPYTVEYYDYTKGKGLVWETDVNKENMYSIKFNTLSSWQDRGFSNMYVLFFGLRGGHGGKTTFPIGKGWGCGPVNSNLWEDWLRDEPNDLRRIASICDAKTEFGGNYKYGDNQMEDTGFWQKKYTPIMGYNEQGVLKNYPIIMYGAFDNIQLCHTQDLVLMRFADVLLMHSELTETNDGMTKVRERVGLAEVPYTLDNLKKERRYELAFEGVRWFDIMRWGDAPDLLAKQIGVEIYNESQENTIMKEFGGGYKKRYEETGGFWPIPNSQIDLSDGVLTQNKGWGTPNSEYPGW